MSGGYVRAFEDDCRNVLRTLPDHSIDSVVTDPPYALVSIVKRFGADGAAPAKGDHANGAYLRASAGFMGKQWDNGETAFAVEFWSEVWRVLKPGGHVAAFGGTRSYHRLACAIEDAGFEIRDQLAWVYGSGFPKSLDVSKAIDKAAGVEREKIAIGAPVKRIIPGADQNATGSWVKDNGREYQPGIEIPATPAARQWEGWGTALKPAWEPICLARKPLSEKTVAANVLRWGTGAINVDGCRVGTEGGTKGCTAADSNGIFGDGLNGAFGKPVPGLGRFPANLCHDGSQEVLDLFPSPHGAGAARKGKFGAEYDATSYDMGGAREMGRFGDSGSAARFFYCAKASKADRAGSKHPTVKPIKLMQWLCRMVTPPNGVVLDPFAGTGTTGQAAQIEAFDAILIEREAEYFADIIQRVGLEV